MWEDLPSDDPFLLSVHAQLSGQVETGMFVGPLVTKSFAACWKPEILCLKKWPRVLDCQRRLVGSQHVSQARSCGDGECKF